jgi:hypothetical protein
MYVTSYFFVGGLCVIGATLCRTASVLYGRKDAVSTLEHTYATVPAHLAEFSFWAITHTRAAVTRSAHRAGVTPRAASRRRTRALYALLACLLLVVTGLLPAAAIAATKAGSLASHTVVVGIGGLIWTCVLETATLRERITRLAGREILRTPLWMWVLLLVVLDVLLMIACFVVPHLNRGHLLVGLFGAAYVAMADLVSCYIGFLLSSSHPYLLSRA